MQQAPIKSPALAGAWSKVREWFTLDVRSLAVFRVGLALLALFDLADRVAQLTAHYTDAGVFPRAAWTGLPEVWGASKLSFSFHLLNGEGWFQAVIFTVAALAMLGMLVGYRTRLMTALVWVYLVSIQNRTPIILNSADGLMRLMFFWGMCLPLGACWSVDRWRKRAGPGPRCVSLAGTGLVAQIVAVYWVTAVLKNGAEWRTDFTAIYYALSIDQYSAPVLGSLLYTMPGVMKFLTFAVFWLEALGPCLLFSPVWTPALRTLGVCAIVGLHIGIWFTLALGAFPFVSSVAVVSLLPTAFWDGLGRRLAGARHANEWVKHLAGVITRGSGPDAPTVGPGRVLNVITTSLAVAGLTCLAVWNFGSVYGSITERDIRYPRLVSRVGCFLRLDQAWEMFAPYPLKDDGWYVIPGTLRNGRQVDLMGVTRGDFATQGVSWEKPAQVARTYRNERWRKYMMNLFFDAENQRPHFARWVCREWNARHGVAEQLEKLEVVFMLETTAPDYRRVQPEKRVLIEHRCE